MPSCEKCWSDAFDKSYSDPFKDQADYYKILIDERKDKPCTPEEQAGQDATICQKCKQKTMHQINSDVCMNPECI